MSNALVKKLSPKTVMGDLKKLVIGVTAGDNPTHVDGDKIALYTVLGQASNNDTGTSDFGDWFALKGTFEATIHFGADAGKTIASKACFLPSPWDEVTYDQVEKAKQHMIETGEVCAVEFALKIGIVVDSTQSRGYQFYVDSLIDIPKASALDNLRAQIAGQLEAPKEEKPKAKKAAK